MNEPEIYCGEEQIFPKMAATLDMKKHQDSYALESIGENVDKEQRQIDDLLYTAVERNSARAVLMILSYAMGPPRVPSNLHPDSSTGAESKGAGESNGPTMMEANQRVTPSSVCQKWKQKRNVRAVILAAQRGYHVLMKIFISRGFDIGKPHDFMCKCWLCQEDPLAQLKLRIATYRALCNPIWISLTSRDPLETAFELSREIARLEKIEDAYENVFVVMAKQVDRYCMDLLDCVESSVEQYKLLNMVEYTDESDCDLLHGKWSLKLIKLAFRYKLKTIVAHPIPQHVITSLVFDNIPRWRSGGSFYRFSYIMAKSLMFPITSLGYLLFPCTSFGQSAQEPLVKFISGASSFVTFLGLLALIAALPTKGIRKGDAPTGLEILVFVWLISLLVAELNQLSQTGWFRYFTSGWNWMDISMISLMLTSYFLWVVLWIVQTPGNKSAIEKTRKVSNGLFTCGTIMSFFRLVYLCQITRFLGLLQLCLGKMIEVIFQFAFISCVVLWSFSVGMVFLHSSLDGTNQKFNATVHTTSVQNILGQGFKGLPATMVTLAWASLNMVGLKSLEDFDDGGIIYLWSGFLFTLYYGVSMIVLLNMLIAMMSNSYQQIENNIEVEHKYAKSQLWVDYIGNENFLPCPFNLIPSWKSIRKIYLKIKNGKNKKEEKSPRSDNQAPTEYEKTLKLLVKRYLKTKHKIDIAELENEGTKQPSLKENIEFEASVRSFIDQLRKNKRGFPQKMRSFEDSGLDISFAGEPSTEQSEIHVKL